MRHMQQVVCQRFALSLRTLNQVVELHWAHRTRTAPRDRHAQTPQRIRRYGASDRLIESRPAAGRHFA
jgi:hypothetical protein